MPDVRQPFGQRRQVEAILTVKPARAIQNGRVELLRMVGRSDHYHTFVVRKPVQFVQQERAVFVFYQGVEILQHYKTRRASPRSDKNSAHIILLRAAPRIEAFDVQAGQVQFIDQRLDRMRFAIARRPDQQDAALPGYAVFSIDLPRSEEEAKIFAQLTLQLRRQDQVIESRALDRSEELFI